MLLQAVAVAVAMVACRPAAAVAWPIQRDRAAVRPSQSCWFRAWLYAAVAAALRRTEPRGWEGAYLSLAEGLS